MRFKHAGTAFLLSILGAVVACGHDSLGPALPYDLSIVAGEDQVGSAGWPLDSLTVRLADADGEALNGIDVVWLVTSGEGSFRVLLGGHATWVASIVTQTGTHGEGAAAAQFVPTRVGTSVVTAYAARAGGYLIGTAEFTAEVETVTIVLDRNADWEAVWPGGPQDVSIPLGSAVEWRPIQACCDQRVRSVAVPDGATPFDEPVSVDSAFAFEPDAPGTWTWVWDHDEDDLETWWPETVSDTATFVVQQPI